MAPHPPAPLLVIPTLTAAQSNEPSPPSQQQQPPTNTSDSDAAALHAVFKQWGLEDGAAAGEDPCGKRVWFESARNASINCSCSDSPNDNECRITHLCASSSPEEHDQIGYRSSGRRLFSIDIQDQNIRTDFDIIKEAGGSRRATNITH